jgi:excisionase family DNA binding protein
MKTPPFLPSQHAADSGQNAPLLRTIRDTGRQLAVSRRTIERLIAQGELESVGAGKLRRVLHESIVAYINRHRNNEGA